MPNRSSPNVYHLRGFKIDVETMRAFLKAIEANPVRNVTIHISRCNLTPEAFDLFCSDADFSIINHLTLVGPLDDSKRKLFDIKKLFQVNLESLKLPCWGLTDEFMDDCIEVLQKNESLMLLSLDFNKFQRMDHVIKILRVNRKLMGLSIRNVNNTSNKVSDITYSTELLEMNDFNILEQLSIDLQNLCQRKKSNEKGYRIGNK